MVAHLLAEGFALQPFYVRCGLVWEQDELAALKSFLQAIAGPGLLELRIFELPLGDLYGSHWSLDGVGTPDARSPDQAVYLPGRNLLLSIKPAIWCGLNGIKRLALATLAENPFADATTEFFQDFQRMLERTTAAKLTIFRPFAHLRKADVLFRGRHLPLELTFSCIAPIDGMHCGQCNKCAERRKAFQYLKLTDPTAYFHS